MFYSVDSIDNHGTFAITFSDGTHTIFVKKIGDKYILAIDERLPNHKELSDIGFFDS